MDIITCDLILEGLQEYNNSLDINYGNVVVSYPTSDTHYPYAVFDEIRNVAMQNHRGLVDRVASLGYRLDIYAKTKGKMSKRTIARYLAEKLDTYLNSIGLSQISYNISELENDSTIYHIIITYSGNLLENRRKLI